MRRSAKADGDAGRYGPAGRSAWLDVDWTGHQRWVAVDGDWVNTIDMGPADAEETLVFVHGLAGSWQNWLETLPHFAGRHRCIALDLPGFGASPMPAGPISIHGYAATLDTLLRELGVTRATIVGNSMGGFIGLEVALAFPTWVRGLVLVSAAGLAIEHLRRDPLLATLGRLDAFLAAYGGWLASRSDAVARRRRSRSAVLRVVARHPGRLPGPLVAEQLRGSGSPGFLPAVDALTSFPIRDRLHAITAPTLVVWGARDHLVPVRDAWDFGRRIPGARVVVLPDTGHVAMLERPDTFNALVDGFLAETARDAARPGTHH